MSDAQTEREAVLRWLDQEAKNYLFNAGIDDIARSPIDAISRAVDVLAEAIARGDHVTQDKARAGDTRNYVADAPSRDFG